MGRREISIFSILSKNGQNLPFTIRARKKGKEIVEKEPGRSEGEVGKKRGRGKGDMEQERGEEKEVFRKLFK